MEEKITLLEKLDDWGLDHMPGFLYRIPTRIRDIYHSIIYLIQKIFRKNHISNIEIWNLYNCLGDFILPKLQAFIKAERVGYPTAYSEYNKNSGWQCEEDYDEAKRKGNIIGGGPKRWEADLKEMLFAFEYIKYDDMLNKKTTAFYKRWNLEDPHEEKKENECKSFMDDESIFYYNSKLANEYSKRAQKGFELFGEHFQSLWD